MIEYSVTVEKDGWALTLASNFVLRAGERVRNANIDEITLERHRQKLSGTGKQWEDVFLERTAAIEPVGQRTLEHIDAAAHQPISRTLGAFAKSGKSTVVNFDHPITGSIRQQSDGNCAGCGWLADGAAGKFEQIDIEPRVAVEQKEPVIEAVARMPDRAAGTGALGLDRHLNLQAEPRLQRGRRRVFDNARGCKPGEQQDPRHPMASQLEHQHIEKGNPIDQ